MQYNLNLYLYLNVIATLPLFYASLNLVFISGSQKSPN